MPELALAVIAVVPLCAVELAKAARWRVLFGAQPPPFVVCLRALIAGQLTNALSPVRAGEAVRLTMLMAEGGSLVSGGAAMAGAKAIDTVALAAIAAAVVGSAALAHAGWGLAGGVAVGLAGLIVAARGHAVRRRLASLSWAKRVRLETLVDVAEALRDPQALAVVAGTTAIVWLAGLAANAIVLTAVGVTPTPDLAARVIVAGYFAAMLPAPPARLGVFEASVAAALTSGGVPLGQAIAAGVVLHVCQFAELGLLTAVGLGAYRWGPHPPPRARPSAPHSPASPVELERGSGGEVSAPSTRLITVKTGT